MSDPRTWTVHTANERLKLLAKLRAQHAELLGLFDAELADIGTRRAALIAAFSHEEEHLLIGLEAYYHSHPPVKGKSLVLPHGTLSSRDGGPGSIKIVDEPVAMEWARKNLPAAIKLGVDSLYKDPFMDYLVNGGGELAPGIELVPGRESFKAVAAGDPPKKQKAPKGEAE